MNLIIVCNFVICRQINAIFKRLVFLHTGRVNKVGVVSTSGLNENLELKKSKTDLHTAGGIFNFFEGS